MRQKLNVCISFTCGQLQGLTSKYSPRNQGTLLMECVKASGAPGSSRREPKTTHEVFSLTQSCEPAEQKTLKIGKTLHFTRGSPLYPYDGYIVGGNTDANTKSLLFPRRVFYTVLGA